MNLAPYFKLVRIPNLPTVIADVAAGYFVASRSGLMELTNNIVPAAVMRKYAVEPTPAWGQLALLIVAAMLLYMGGMANNDLQHAEKDHALGKPRPIPLGQISFGVAWWISTLGLIGGVSIAALTMGKLGGIAFGIAVCAYAYNWLAKGRCVDGRFIPPKPRANALGALLMALCRVGSVGLGLAFGALVKNGLRIEWAMADDPLIWIFAATTLFYFMGVMAASLLEDFGGGARALKWLRVGVMLPVWAGPLTIGYLIYGEATFDRSTQITLGMSAAPALVLLIALTLLIQRRFSIAIKDPTPRNVGMIVKWSILGHVWLAASIVCLSGRHAAGAGLAIAALFGLCLLLSRLSYST